VNGERLWRSLMDLARIAPGKPAGKSRLDRSLEAAISVFKH